MGRTVIKFVLHVFPDASMLGYGAASYVKTVYRDNSTQCCFVFGKSRVTPLKPVSVPRLELIAAVLAAKISQFVIRECDFKFSRVFLWTDSTVVLRYINNTSTRFKTFIANRKEIIHSLTNVKIGISFLLRLILLILHPEVFGLINVNLPIFDFTIQCFYVILLWTGQDSQISYSNSP